MNRVETMHEVLITREDFVKIKTPEFYFSIKLYLVAIKLVDEPQPSVTSCFLGSGRVLDLVMNRRIRHKAAWQL